MPAMIAGVNSAIVSSCLFDAVLASSRSPRRPACASAVADPAATTTVAATMTVSRRMFTSESESHAHLNQPRAAGQDPARAIDNEQFIKEILDGHEQRGTGDGVVHRRVPDRIAGDEPALTVGRRLDRVEIVAELLARVDRLNPCVESGARVADANRCELLRRVRETVAADADSAEAGDAAEPSARELGNRQIRVRDPQIHVV